MLERERKREQNQQRHLKPERKVEQSPLVSRKAWTLRIDVEAVVSRRGPDMISFVPARSLNFRFQLVEVLLESL